MKFTYFFLIFSITFGLNKSLDFVPQDQNTGLSFVKLGNARVAYDSYTILYHFDLTQYFNLTKHVEDMSHILKVRCRELESKTCKTMLDELIVHISHMKRDELDILAYQQKHDGRRKRALEFVGGFFNWAFGLLDADAAREYDAKIQNLAGNSQRFHKILKDQTILIRESLQLNNNTINDLRQAISKFTSTVRYYFAYAHDAHNYLTSEIAVNECVTLADLIITEHRRFSQQILRCLEEVISGKIIQLIPEDRLTQDLYEVEKLLKENQKLPIDFKLENPLHIFKYSKTLSSLYGNRLLMEISIPIVERETYSAFEIIPIPIVVNNNTMIIKPATQYILLNNDAKEYIPISEKEFRNSKFNLRGERIIKPAENAYLDFSQNCEIGIFINPQKDNIIKYCDIKFIPTSNYFVSLNNNDLFFLNIVKKVTLIEYCPNTQPNFTEITGNGLVTLNRDCRVVTDKISIRPRSNYRFDSSEIITLANHSHNAIYESIFEKLQLNLSSPIPMIDDNVLIQDYSVDYKKLVSKADKLIEKANLEHKWSEMSTADFIVTRNSFGFTLIVAIIIIILIIAIVFYFYKRFFNIDTWEKLASVLGRNYIDRIPRLFVRTDMDSDRIQRGSLVHMEQPSSSDLAVEIE